MSVRGVSDWENDEVGPEAFFLGKTKFFQLYANAEWRYRQYLEALERGQDPPPKKVLPPAEQLSPKGLALISYLYAQKDKSEAQPLVADSVANLKHISKLMDDAPIGTSVTVIFQPTSSEGASLRGYWAMAFSPVHKTVIKMERTSEGLRLIHMDGTNNSSYPYLAGEAIKDALKENAQTKGREQTPIKAYTAVAKDFADPNKGIENQGRQKSEFECGIFATKDARELNRDTSFYERHLKEVKPTDDQSDPLVLTHRYELPVKYMKSAQSTSAYKALLKDFGGEVVTRKGKTLQQTFDKHVDSYANHFGLKYNEQVLKFLEGKKPEEVRAAVEQYDAAKMTMERLINVYGPKQSPELTQQSMKRKSVQLEQGSESPIRKKKKSIGFHDDVEVRTFEFLEGEEVREDIPRGIRRKSADEKSKLGKKVDEQRLNKPEVPPEIAQKHKAISEIVTSAKAYMSMHLDSVNRYGIKRYDHEEINNLNMKLFELENPLRNNSLPEDNVLKEFMDILDKCPIDPDLLSERESIYRIKDIFKDLNINPKQALLKEKQEVPSSPVLPTNLPEQTDLNVSVNTPEQKQQDKAVELARSRILDKLSVLLSQYGVHCGYDYPVNDVSINITQLNHSEDFRNLLTTLGINHTHDPVSAYPIKISLKSEQYETLLPKLEQEILTRQKLQEDLKRKLAAADTLDKIVQVLNSHQGDMLSSSGIVIKAVDQLKAIEQLRKPPGQDEKRLKVTSNYGLEEKVKKLLAQEQLKNRQQEMLDKMNEVIKVYAGKWSMTFDQPSVRFENFGDNTNKVQAILQELGISVTVNSLMMSISGSSMPVEKYDEFMKKVDGMLLNRKNDKDSLNRQINVAQTVDDIVRILTTHQKQGKEMFSKGGSHIPIQEQLAAIQKLRDPNVEAKTKVTSNYGLEEKVKNLMEQENIEKLKAQQTPSISPTEVKEDTRIDPLKNRQQEMLEKMNEVIKIYARTWSMTFDPPSVRFENFGDNTNKVEAILQELGIAVTVNSLMMSISGSSMPVEKYDEFMKKVDGMLLNRKNDQDSLNRQINEAQTVDDIVRILTTHQKQGKEMFSKGGQLLNIDYQIKAVEKHLNPKIETTEKVTSNYGLEEKVKKLVAQEQMRKAPLVVRPLHDVMKPQVLNVNDQSLTKQDLEILLKKVKAEIPTFYKQDRDKKFFKSPFAKDKKIIEIQKKIDGFVNELNQADDSKMVEVYREVEKYLTGLAQERKDKTKFGHSSIAVALEKVNEKLQEAVKNDAKFKKG